MARPFALLLSVALLAVAPGPAHALTIVDSPQNTASTYKHNVFHDASGAGGAGGNILAWLDLDASLGPANFYNPATGALQAVFQLYADSALTQLLGTTSAVGTTLLGATFGDLSQNNVIVGTIDWSIDLSSSAGSVLETYLETNFGDELDDVWEHQTKFADVFYVTSPQGRTANTWTGLDLTLWGADGTFIGSNKLGGPGKLGGFGGSADFGSDVVMTVPEPTTLLLTLGGLLGLTVAGARRR